MGGCCGTCRDSRLHGTPIYYYCPQGLEEHESLASHDSAAVTPFTGYVVHPNLDASSPDTYRRPPTPIPFDAVLGSPQSTDSECAGSSFQKASPDNCTALDCKAQDDTAPATLRKSELELPHLIGANFSTTEEEDVCPTCFEDYNAENPKVITKCNHHFHLSCIFEWMERSDTCPMCNQEMDFEVL